MDSYITEQFESAIETLNLIQDVSDIATGKKIIIDIDEYLELKNSEYKDQFIKVTICTEEYTDKKQSYSGVTKIHYNTSDTESFKELNDMIASMSKNVNLYNYTKEELEDIKGKISNSVYWEKYYHEKTKELETKVSELEKFKIPFYKRIFIKNNKKA